MRWKRTLQLLDVHCEGEIGRVATGGVPKNSGATVADKLNWLNTDPKGEELRRFLTLEPRGTPIGSVNLLLPPKHPDADAAFVILQPDQAHASSGSNSICATTALLESGMVEMKEPETIVMLETAAGLVKATATCKDGRCEKVKLTMVPSFVHELDVEIDTPDWGRIRMDISYGGIFLCAGGCASDRAHHRQGQRRQARGRPMVLKDIVNRDIPVVHPEIPAISGVALCHVPRYGRGWHHPHLHHHVAGPRRSLAMWWHRQLRQSGDAPCARQGEGG